MGKKKHASATVCAAGSSRSKAMENLKTLNKQLEKEVTESRKQIELLRFELQRARNNKLMKEVGGLRKQIEQLRLELASQTAEQDILAEMERDVIRLVVSSALAKATASGNMEMAAVMKKAESAAAQLNAVEVKRNSVLESLEKARKKTVNPTKPELGGRRWMYHVAAAMTPFCAAAAIFYCSKSCNLKA